MMKRHVVSLVALSVGVVLLGRADAAPKRAPIRTVAENRTTRPPVDLVFAIDCSGSMGGVIEGAKQKVWDIVNEVAKARPVPHLRIGLLGYGDGDKTWRKFDLSDDLDTVYANLMTFKDEGWGDEYVGQALQKSLAEMSWSRADGSETALKIIYVLGNETAEQGPISYQKTAPLAMKRAVFVNAIYCGSGEDGQETWQRMAKLGGGQYLEIAGDGGAVTPPTPYDAKIAGLNAKLNGTYLAYGARAEAASRNQAAQDSNAARAGGSYAAASRALAKSSSQYNNSGWDLVDRARQPGFKLKAIPSNELPAPMQKMTLAQRASYLQTKTRERANLQKQLQTLGKQRGDYLRVALKKQSKGKSLDAAMLGLVRRQAKARGFRFSGQ